MREFRFRAYHKTENWIDGVWSLDFEHQLLCFTNHDQEDMANFELMQYTGLLDDNEKEIWEGDIVKVKDGLASGKTYLAQVLWFDEGCQFITQTIEDKSGNWDIMQGAEFGGFYEVIGNVYENKDLIK